MHGQHSEGVVAMATISSTEEARPAGGSGPGPLGVNNFRIAGWAALAAGLAHVFFALTSAIVGLIVVFPEFTTPAFMEPLHWVGFQGWLTASLWGLAIMAATMCLGRLMWDTGQLLGTLMNGLGVIAGAGMMLTGAVTIAQYGGNATAIGQTGADLPAQVAALQSTWVGGNAGVYLQAFAFSVWLAVFAVSACRTGLFGRVFLAATLLVVISSFALAFLTPYPTTGIFISLYLIVLGIILLRRGRRARVHGTRTVAVAGQTLPAT